MSNYIEDYDTDWAREFAYDLNIRYRKEHDAMVRMSCYTILHHIADNFRDGELRQEILKFVMEQEENNN